MKPGQLLFLLFCAISHVKSYAATDTTLPPCINTKRINDKMDITEYDYKGQRWFVMAKATLKVENYPDKLTTIQFYNGYCNLVCTWKKGGIAGFNKVIPDSIDKTKILLLRTIKFDSLVVRDTIQRQLPDTISKIGLHKNAVSIQEYTYLGQTLYNLYPTRSLQTRQELLAKGIKTIDEPYYDDKGKVIIVYKRAIEGMFMRASGWIPSTVKQADVIKVTSGTWYNNKGKFENKPLPRITTK